MPRAQGVEVRTPVLEQAHGLAVEDDALDRKSRHRRADQWKVLGASAPAARPQVHHAALARGDDPVAIPFELVNPLRPGRDLANEDRLTGADEARRLMSVTGTDGTPNHTMIMSDEIASG